ncbi:MAG: alpha-ribazole phosphatase [Bacteroides sp.]
MELTLIRHTAVDVLRGVCYGQTDVPLKANFEQEAAITAARLHQQVATEGGFDEVYTSPLSRCVRLAEYCGYNNARRDDRLKELNFGAWEMQPFDAITDPRLADWYADYFHVAATEGESFSMQYARVAAFLNELKQRAQTARAALFTHGGVLICAQLYAGVLTKEEAFGALTPYGGIVRLTY